MTASQSQVDECIRLIKENDIKLVAFDMDQTAVAMHSHGQLKREDVESYVDCTTTSFRTLVPALKEQGISVAIATHSDEAEFQRETIDPETHILGLELAQAVVRACFAPTVAEDIFVVAYNPKWHGQEGMQDINLIKRYHMRILRDRFRVEPNQLLFFDDTANVVQDCKETCGVHAVLVDAVVGFQWADLLNYFNKK